MNITIRVCIFRYNTVKAVYLEKKRTYTSEYISFIEYRFGSNKYLRILIQIR
jgi:hypothetical protein